jgi:DNA-binding transcriptional MocR family regulator
MTTSPPSPSPHESISAATLARVVSGFAGDPGPLYRSLARAVVAAVDRGDIPPGARLPAERRAAAQLGLARGTVVAGYDLLRDEGVVERRRGSGTWVVGPAAAGHRLAELAAGLRARQLTRDTVSHLPAIVDLALSVLPSPAGLPAAAFRVDLGELSAVAHGHGYHPMGLPLLRERLAALHTAHGLATAPDQIVVTQGAQQAVALTARLLVHPGDVVAVESPTYPGAIDAYSRAGARFAPMAGDSAGVRPDEVARVVRHASPRLVYVVPTGQNPRGTVLPDQRRRHLAAVVEDGDTWLVEDETHAWTVYGADGPTVPIAAHGAAARVLTIGSLSKVLWGGLRLGWIRGPAPTIARIGRIKAAQDLGNDAVSQAIVLGLLDRLDEIAASRRRALAAGAELLRGLLATSLPAWRVVPPAAGLSLWVRLPSGTGDAFAPVALRHGVRVLAGSAASPDEAHLDHLRLAVSPPPDQLHTAVRRLADAWREHAGPLGPACAADVDQAAASTLSAR